LRDAIRGGTALAELASGGPCAMGLTKYMWVKAEGAGESQNSMWWISGEDPRDG